MKKSSLNNPASEKFVFAVVSQAEDRLEDKLEELDKKNEKGFNKTIHHLVKIAGQFQKFGEEQTVLSAHSKRHEDRLEKLESVVFTTS
ncbi:MAG: hypothetical protein ABIJ85_01450 [bacterium]